MENTVIYRTFELGDVDRLYQWMNDDELKSLSFGLNRRMSREEVENWVMARKNHNPYQVFWAICPKDMPEKIIGYACLTDIHYINSSANFSGIVIGDKEYRDGFAWLETYLFIMEYAFERLNLNRLYGENVMDHIQSHTIGSVLFWKREGIMRQAVYKGGRYYDVSMGSILRSEYMEHKNNGDYSLMKIIRRMKAAKDKKNTSIN